MKHPERVEDYLEHIAEAIERATGYLQPVPDLKAFEKNQQIQDAIVRNIEISRDLSQMSTARVGIRLVSCL